MPNKSLGDEGLAAIADALEDALRLCPELVLVEINLPGNKLTTWSLSRLAPIIHHARLDLQIVNVSGNGIELRSQQQVKQWEHFLRSFEHCRCLRTLDISSNPRLGHQALEVLARVYIQERPVDPITSGTSSPTAANGLECAMILPYRAGLRSLPYLILRDVGMGDAGALFLATISIVHYFPAQLIAGNDAPTHSKSSLANPAYSPPHGIDWAENSRTLSKDGHALLAAAVKLRAYALGCAPMDLDTTDTESSTEPESRTVVLSRKKKHFKLPAIAQVADLPKRSATRPLLNMGMEDQEDEHAMVRLEYDLTRKRIERNILMQIGPEHFELWRSALTSLAFSRKLFLCSPYGATEDFATTDASSWHEVVFEPTESDLSINALKLSPNPVPAPLSDISNRSTTSTIVQSDYDLHKFIIDDLAARENEYRLDYDVRCDTTENEYLAWQSAHLESRHAIDGGASDGYRDPSLGCRLPLPVCIRILGHVTGRDVSVTMSQRQLEKAVEWGQWRGSLMIEKDWCSKDAGSQLWMLLDAIECLSY